jgi:hypothetical protein
MEVPPGKNVIGHISRTAGLRASETRAILS